MAQKTQGIEMFLVINSPVQWGLEYQTRFDFEWAKVAWMLNGSDFEKAAILDSCWLVWFSNYWAIAIAVAMVPIILRQNHPKCEHQNVRISDGF